MTPAPKAHLDLPVMFFRSDGAQAERVHVLLLKGTGEDLRTRCGQALDWNAVTRVDVFPDTDLCISCLAKTDEADRHHLFEHPTPTEANA